MEVCSRDVTAERALTLKMARLGQYDVLTNLPNRTLFDDRIAQATARARRNGTRLAVLLVDLDKFKHINDSLGHAIGDALLQSVTARLLKCVRASDTVSRRGGDEFVVLLTELDVADAALVVADNILAALAEPHTIAEHVLHVTGSVGISIYPDDALEAAALIAVADAAMYHAKESGRGNSQFFTREMTARTIVRRSLESSIRKGCSVRSSSFTISRASISGPRRSWGWRRSSVGSTQSAACFTTGGDEIAIIDAIIGMAHGLDHCVVAEGVETAAGAGRACPRAAMRH